MDGLWKCIITTPTHKILLLHINNIKSFTFNYDKCVCIRKSMKIFTDDIIINEILL